MITSNPYVLISIINTKLRDYYDNLDSLCDDLDYDKEQLDKILGDIGYYYDSIKNQYIQK